jgi:hypothetical protein
MISKLNMKLAMKPKTKLSPSISIAFSNITDLMIKEDYLHFGRIRAFTKRVDRILTMDTMVNALDMYSKYSELETILKSRNGQ